MSRSFLNPVTVPAGLSVEVAAKSVLFRAGKGELSVAVPAGVGIEFNDGVLSFSSSGADALVGTVRALCRAAIHGLTQGFERRLQLVGVGYRAQVQGSNLSLSLGFSHPVIYEPPAGVTIEAPTQTEIVIKGIDKQKVGQAAADIRSYRRPEPYKGKGVKYVEETVYRKEAKKK